jgi:hypothetical protein
MRMSGIKALAAAASLVVLGVAGSAQAAIPITVTDVEMYQGYTANIGTTETAWTNIMRFTATGPGGVNVPDLFGFCIDIYHNIGLGPQTLQFSDTKGDPQPLLTTNFDGTSNNLSIGQVKAISDLVDSGYLLYVNNVNTPGSDDMWLQEAAIQAAIWQVENTNIVISVNNSSTTVTGDPTTLGTYFTKFSTGNYNPADYGVTPQDRVFTLLSTNRSQSFAIGWPGGGVPEPATWGLMLVGFGGMGAVLRRNRKAAAVAA